MIVLIISFFFFGLAAMFNAVMDTLQFHYYRSIFWDKNVKFWDPAVSWKHARVIPGTKYKVDAWHLSKSSMIICLAGSASVLLKLDLVLPWWYYLAAFVLYGLVWNGVFNIFYNKILLR